MSEQFELLLGSLDPGCLDVEPVHVPEISPPNTEYSMPVVEGESLARDQIPDYQAIPVECFPLPIQQFILAQAATPSSRPPIQVDRAAVSLTGALSEELLVEKFTKASGPCGLVSRLLFAYESQRVVTCLS